MRTVAIILIIVAIVAVVQVTAGGSPRPCSSEHCSGAGDLKRCGCGCHNCCVKKYDCKGGVCRRFSPFPRGCYCFNCKKLSGAAKQRNRINKDSTRG